MRYRKNYHSALTWSLLAMVLIIALPLVLGIANAVNNNLAAQEITAWRLNNNTLGADCGYANGAVLSYRFYADSTHPYNLSPFWANETDKDDEILFPSYTENTSYADNLYIVLNLSASKILSENMDKLIIDFKGLSNTTNQTYIAIKIQKHLPASDSDIYGLTKYHQTVSIINGTLHYEQKLDPAVMSYAKSTFEKTTYSDIVIQIYAINTADVIFPSNSVIDFKIYAEKPHGGIVINGAQFVDFVAELYGIVFIIAAVFATGAVNPTHKHVFGHLYYGLKRYAKIRRKKKYYRARNKLYHTRRPYSRTRTYRRRYR